MHVVFASASTRGDKISFSFEEALSYTLARLGAAQKLWVCARDPHSCDVGTWNKLSSAVAAAWEPAPLDARHRQRHFRSLYEAHWLRRAPPRRRHCRRCFNFNGRWKETRRAPNSFPSEKDTCVGGLACNKEEVLLWGADPFSIWCFCEIELWGRMEFRLKERGWFTHLNLNKLLASCDFIEVVSALDIKRDLNYRVMGYKGN